MAKYRERLRARELRKRGESIGDIANKLDVSKSSVSVWCRDIELTEEQIERLVEKDESAAVRGRIVAAKLAKAKKNQRIQEDIGFGMSKVDKLSHRDLWVIGIALYWAEGAKSCLSEEFVFVNSDERMILLFLRWLRECLGVKAGEIRCRVGINQIHSNRVSEVEKYWSDLTGIPISQFRKVSIKRVRNKKVYRNFDKYYGTLVIRVRRCTRLFYRMLGYIEGIAAQADHSVLKLGT